MILCANAVDIAHLIDGYNHNAFGGDELATALLEQHVTLTHRGKCSTRNDQNMLEPKPR
jgi:hypothetical protein